MNLNLNSSENRTENHVVVIEPCTARRTSAACVPCEEGLTDNKYACERREKQHGAPGIGHRLWRRRAQSKVDGTLSQETRPVRGWSNWGGR